MAETSATEGHKMLSKPTESDPIQNRQLSAKCWNNHHTGEMGWIQSGQSRYWGVVGCSGWEMEFKQQIPHGDKCDCLCHDPAHVPPKKPRKLKPSDSMDLPDKGSIQV